MADATLSAVRVRYYAAARAAAGTEEEQVPLTTERTLTGLITTCARGRPVLGQVFERCTFLIDGIAAESRQLPVHGGQTVDVLPPFAGG